MKKERLLRGLTLGGFCSGSPTACELALPFRVCVWIQRRAITWKFFTVACYDEKRLLIATRIAKYLSGMGIGS